MSNPRPENPGISWISQCRFLFAGGTFCDLLPAALGGKVPAWLSLQIFRRHRVNLWAARRGLVPLVMVVLRRK